ncbi:porin family protein [Pelagivirga sediminicola]|uniref:Porin family protein n=1 Tax=Pelagivirga sediminicola TaxID=2170575 RepID=A0A2T7G4N6_9RHOB|nr:outer membrane beta-barrel protein [Pelagivirga sediminicola]PVA09393.1 porin family protein [Pelagivirga sediminicola]
MKYLLSATAASALLAGTAFAGNIESAPMEPVIAPAPAPVFTSPNWTGFYAGGQLGYADISGSGTGFAGDRDGDGVDDNVDADGFPIPFGFSANGDGMIGGLTVGYDYDMGDWVVGAAADYDWTDISVGGLALDDDDIAIGYGTTIESIWRAKLRAGYKLGNGLLYATAGYAQADTKDWGNTDGYFVGAGYEHMVTQNISLGGEILYHEFDNFSGVNVPDYDIEATTAQVRATFRF